MTRRTESAWTRITPVSFHGLSAAARAAAILS